VVFVVVAIPVFAVTEIVRRGLRSQLRSTGGFGLLLADSIGNLGGVVVQILVSLGLLNSTRVQGLRVIAFVTTGYIAYEFVQPILPRGTFDWNDVVGTLVGGLCIALPLALLIFRLAPEESD
jgi:hypothetical protein